MLRTLRALSCTGQRARQKAPYQRLSKPFFNRRPMPLSPSFSFSKAGVSTRRHAAKAFVLATVAVLAWIAWGVGVVYQERQDQYRHQAERELQTINQLQAQRIAKWRDQRLADAMALSEDGLLARALVQWRRARTAANEDLLTERLRILQEHARYSAAYLLDTQGRVLMNAQGVASGQVPHAEQQALQEAFALAQGTAVEPRRDPFFAFPFVSMLAPVFQGAEPIGAVWLVSDVRTDLYPLIENWPTTSQSAESSIVARSGSSVLFLSPLRHRENPALTFSVAATRKDDPAVQAVDGARGVFYGQDYRNTRVMAAASAVPGSAWFLVSKIDTAEAFSNAKVREILALSLPISLGLLCAGLVFAALQRRGRLREQSLKIELQRNMRLLEGAQKAASIGYFAYDLEPQIFSMSSMAKETWGITSDVPLTLQDWVSQIHPSHSKEVLQVHTQSMALRQPLNTQYCIRRADDGQTRWVQVWADYEQSTKGGVTRMLGTVQDITERKQTEQDLADYRTMLEEKMRMDPLTNVANRRALDEHVATQWQRAMRSQRALSLLMIDVDHFKRYNDHYGHVDGDECLQGVAQMLASMVSRADEMVARYGGEEFAVLLPDTDAPQALALAQKMCAAVYEMRMPHAASDTAPYITVSIGVACLHPVFCTSNDLEDGNPARASESTLDPELAQALDGVLAQALFEQADAALYSAKKQGRNQAVLQPAFLPEPDEL